MHVLSSVYYVWIWNGQNAIRVGNSVILLCLQKLQSGLQLRLTVGGDVKTNSAIAWELLF